MTNATRRDFMKAATAAGAVGFFSSLASRIHAQSPNERPGIGFIGTGIRFHTYHGDQALRHGHCPALADVDSLQLGRAYQVAVDNHREYRYPLEIDAHEDYRRVLDNKDVDVVCIATVDHWHTKIAIDAMKAGKDVYCEKPLTLTIKEGQQIIDVQKATGRVFQVGTQQRTEFGKRFPQAVAMVRDGRVGKLEEVAIAFGGSRVSGVLPKVAPPKTLNWEKWLGQCPLVDYRQASGIVDKVGWGAGFPFGRAHRYYRWFYEYSGGKLTDWGAHHIDIAMWAMDKLAGDIGNVTIDPQVVEHPVPFKDGMPTKNDQFNCATKFKVVCTFADGLKMIVEDFNQEFRFGRGIVFKGANEGPSGRFIVNRGRIVGRPVEDLKSNPLPEYAIADLYGGDIPTSDQPEDLGAHMNNFFDCVKSRKTPVSDVTTHHRMLSICHAINIALRLNRKLVFDPSTDSFVNDELANSFVGREQRRGYEITV